MIRPLLPADVPAARDVQWAALSELDVRLGQTTPELTPEIRARGEGRIAHLQHTDPESAWVAEINGTVVGCGLALVREGMWFLSLLMVDPAYQGRGGGRELLDATLGTATDRSWILATSDPAALRRYQRAGFDLHATYTAKGTVKAGLLPKGLGVSEGSYAEHADLVEDISRSLRGATLRPDLAFYEQTGASLLVVPGAGYAVVRGDALVTLAATNEDAARRLLWAYFAQATGPVEVDWLAAGQQWAIDVCLDAQLGLEGGASICLRGQPPMPTYLPGGAFG